MGIGSYLKIGLRWWWLILLSVALSGTASYMYSQRLPKVYAARTTLLVGSDITELRNPNAGELQMSQTLAEVYATLLHRAPITRAVIDRLGLEMLPDELSGMIQTSVIPQAQLLEIFVLDVHPQRAQLLANALAEELILQSPTGSGRQAEREQFVNTQLKELQKKMENTDARIKKLEDVLPTLTSAVEIAEAQSQLGELEGLKNNYQVNYNQFLTNLSESSINRLAIFEPALEPTWPISPNVRNNALIAAVAGLALAVTAIILLEFLDDTLVWRREETQMVFDLPVLSAISKIKKADKIIVQDQPWSPEADILRSLRSSLLLAAPGSKLSTLLVTSMEPGEGKSFLAANLAGIFASPGASVASIIASSGTRTILIDADLRKPSLHEKFDMPNLLGLVDVLAAPENAIEAMLEKAIKPTNVDNLFLLPAGRSPLDSGYLLNSPRFQQLLQSLNKVADLVVVDSAPFLVAVETKAIANAVDGVILVVRDGVSRKRPVKEIIKYFKQKQMDNLLGVVFNRVKSSTAYGPSSYYSYSGRLAPDEMEDQAVSPLRKIWSFGRSRPVEMGGLGLTEMAEYLGISRETARRWCEEGRLPARRQGRQWVVRLEDLNEFIRVYQNDGDRHPGLLVDIPEISRVSQIKDGAVPVTRVTE